MAQELMCSSLKSEVNTSERNDQLHRLDLARKGVTEIELIAIDS